MSTDPTDPEAPADVPADVPASGTVSVSSAEMFPDEGPLPASSGAVDDDDELRDAVGVTARGKKAAPAAAPPTTTTTTTPTRPTPPRKRDPRDEDDDDDRDDDEAADGPPKKRGRTPLVVALALLIGGGFASCFLVGNSNSARYFFVCGESKITAERGDGIPFPWGSSRMGGAEWAPIEIPPEAECESRETESLDELAGWYLEALTAQAEVQLTARDVTSVDRAETELEQALLLARDPERRDQRKEIERLLGDVDYWRGQARVKAAIDTLDEAGKRFDVANEKRPRHASDAAAWATFVRRLSSELAGGPSGVRPDTKPDPTDGEEPRRTDIPTGVALPIEDGADAPTDAGVGPPIDARLPQGGVLL